MIDDGPYLCSKTMFFNYNPVTKLLACMLLGMEWGPSNVVRVLYWYGSSVLFDSSMVFMKYMSFLREYDIIRGNSDGILRVNPCNVWHAPGVDGLEEECEKYFNMKSEMKKAGKFRVPDISEFKVVTAHRLEELFNGKDAS